MVEVMPECCRAAAPRGLLKAAVGTPARSAVANYHDISGRRRRFAPVRSQVQNSLPASRQLVAVAAMGSEVDQLFKYS